MNRRAVTALLCALAAAGTSLPAQKLEVGSPAPEIAVSHWIKGNPVSIEKAKGKQITVVEFWATW